MPATSALTSLHSFQRRDIHEELLKSQKVFSEKLNHLSRRLAWINVTIYSKVGRSVTSAAQRRPSQCASASVLLGSHVTSVVLPGGAMLMISGPCFSFLVHQRLFPRPGPLLSQARSRGV